MAIPSPIAGILESRESTYCVGICGFQRAVYTVYIRFFEKLSVYTEYTVSLDRWWVTVTADRVRETVVYRWRCFSCGKQRNRLLLADCVNNEGWEDLWALSETCKRTDTVVKERASERRNKLVKKTRNNLRNRQQHETTQAYLRSDSHYKRLRHFQDEVPKHYLESVKQQINRMAQLVEEDAAESWSCRWGSRRDSVAEEAAEI